MSHTGLSCHYFNPRSGERSDECVYRIYTHSDRFQSTLRRTERLGVIDVDPDIVIFQSTLRRTERPIGVTHGIVLSLFQSTLRRTERQRCLFFSTAYKYFNPRSGERSDHKLRHTHASILAISIHAPANGATISAI